MSQHATHFSHIVLLAFLHYEGIKSKWIFFVIHNTSTKKQVQLSENLRPEPLAIFRIFSRAGHIFQ